MRNVLIAPTLLLSLFLSSSAVNSQDYCDDLLATLQEKVSEANIRMEFDREIQDEMNAIDVLIYEARELIDSANSSLQDLLAELSAEMSSVAPDPAVIVDISRDITEAQGRLAELNDILSGLEQEYADQISLMIGNHLAMQNLYYLLKNLFIEMLTSDCGFTAAQLLPLVVAVDQLYANAGWGTGPL